MINIAGRIALELSAKVSQVEATIQLLDGGDSVPFIARYRKEVTGGLDDTQLRHLHERLSYLREMDDRRVTILASIEEQGKLSPALKASILEAETKTRLEDLYRPYMIKRRTKAQIAREAGLEALAHALLEDPGLDPEATALHYLNEDKGIADSRAALEGARQILMEEFAEDADLVGQLREYLWSHARLKSAVIAEKETAGAKFSDYFDYSEPVNRIPSHRAMALFRGRHEGILNLVFVLPEEEKEDRPPKQALSTETMIAARFKIREAGRPADRWLLETVHWAWRVRIFTHLDTDLKSRLRETAEEEAIKVFGQNLHDLLLAAPAGLRATMGLDPGLRTGVKVAVVDLTGKVVDTATIYPHVPRKQWEESIATLSTLAGKHHVELISIGNGTASRETDKLAADLMKRHPELKLKKVMTSEAGASVYSASALAAREFPDMDVSLRGAVSIARRLQDPLAELVKIEPKAIGVGQYQHDVSQPRLARTLGAVIEDCVNAVGVDINTASAPLLTHVAGLTAGLANNIVAFRDEHGVFRNRSEFLKVPRLGEKAFEQSAGFLRIMNGENPLDASAVHPEAYPVVQRIVEAKERKITNVIGDSTFLRSLEPADFIDDQFGAMTIKDILQELEKPGRDPRPEFKAAVFKEGVEELKDLESGMILEGVVTNVTNFGAFVDIGVHQDGLVHISVMADRFVKDPREIVTTGDLVKVKVLEVDLTRKRVSLTMRLADEHSGKQPSLSREQARKAGTGKPGSKGQKPPAPMGAMAQAFAKLKK